MPRTGTCAAESASLRKQNLKNKQTGELSRSSVRPLVWDKAPKPSQGSLEALLCDCLLTFLKDCARATYCSLRLMLSANSSMMQQLSDQPFF